jgi:threonine/homoserine/homoserine lactone efflux protein
MQVGFGGIAPGMFGLYVLTEGVLSLTPGPAVLFVAGRGLNDGAAAAFPAALGIVLANGVCFGLSALGVGAAIAALPTLFLLLKWLGAASAARGLLASEGRVRWVERAAGVLLATCAALVLAT